MQIYTQGIVGTEEYYLSTAKNTLVFADIEKGTNYSLHLNWRISIFIVSAMLTVGLGNHLTSIHSIVLRYFIAKVISLNCDF